MKSLRKINMTETFIAKTQELLSTLDGFRVEVDPEKQRADIILDRPPLNIIEIPQRDQLRLVFEELDKDDRVRVIVVRAEGKHFSSGGNIAGFLAASPELVSRLADNIAAPARCHKPVIAANRGYTFGVGFELSLACDFRIASDTTLYALPEQRIGQIPGSGGSIRLLHMIGMQRTKDMTFRSRRVSGKEAKEWGFILDCVPDEQLEKETDKLVEELKGFSPLAQRTIKGVLNAAQNTTVEAGIEIEGNAYGRLRTSDDFAEGVAAFHEKRTAVFKGS
jgi:2-oxoglutaroyl-CoA hydrolase|tara:strand:- start:4607 stop:5440 length:834 start_codon:yes stop_codon:yes gene_type:complete